METTLRGAGLLGASYFMGGRNRATPLLRITWTLMSRRCPMDQTPEYCVFPTCPVLADLRQTVRTMHDDASALQVRVDDLKAAGRQARDEATAALDLVSRIRMALNDNGKRMQDELLAYCRELVEKEAGLIAAQARIKVLEMQAPGYAEQERERIIALLLTDKVQVWLPEASDLWPATADDLRKLLATASDPNYQPFPGAWWCPTCQRHIPGQEVTYEETHDPRCGGCGQPVE